MARNARTKRFTVYDVMEARGDFEENPANACSPNYVGPVEYPKMLYHPEGKEFVRVPAEEIRNSQGDVVARIGEKREIITQIVNSQEEERALRDEGWHTHPAMAIAASGRTPPPISAEHRMTEMEKKIRELEAELELARQRDLEVERAKRSAPESHAKAPREPVLPGALPGALPGVSGAAASTD